MAKRSFQARLGRVISGEEADSKPRLIQAINRKISSSLDLNEALDFIVDAVREAIFSDAAAIYLFDSENQAIKYFVGRGYSDSEKRELPLKSLCGIVGWVIISGESVLATDVVEHPYHLNCRAGTRSQLTVPIVNEDKVIGAFNLESDTPANFTEEDLEWLRVLATQVAISIEMALLHQGLVEKKRLEEQLRIARDVQLSLLPTAAPQVEGLDIAGLNIPSESVGGDYFDFIPIVDGHLGLVIADVVGKGIPASLMMASFRAFLRAEIRNNYAIRTIFSKVNNLLKEGLQPHQFVTAFYGVLDLKRQRLTYSNAGHQPPILLRSGEPQSYLSSGGTVLGVFEDTTYQEGFIDLVPGDILVLYTDGVVEAEDGAGEMYGRERLEQSVQAHADLGAGELCEAAYAKLLHFTGGRRLPDDTTIMVAKIVG